jgi:hypothetical protein
LDRPDFLSLNAIAFVLTFAFVGFAISVLRAKRLGEPRVAAVWSGIETALAALLGALASRSFTWILLSTFDFDSRSVAAVGWMFHFWPGLLDSLCLLSVGETAFSARGLVEWATAIGAIVGFWDGLHQIHNWRRGAGLTFLLDVTWAGAGVGIGVVIHFLNLGWGGFIVSRRIGAHRYDAGVAAKRGFAITVGNVCSNLHGQAENSLFRHERIHVLQNRLFGPLFLYSYVGWMAVLFVPAIVWGVVVRRPFAVVFSWCYLNNPWEEWAYRYGGSRDPDLLWPLKRIIVITLVFVLGIAGGLTWLARFVRSTL